MEQLVNFIIRPPRAEYDPNSDLLDQEFILKGKWFQRKDVEVKNSRGDVLQCSHYVPIDSPEGKPLPCVIYCHGNSGCRADASEAAIILLPSNITVFALDFSGSGLSGGEHVTLGWNEKDDLKAVVDYLRSDGNVSLIGLWGRSMGAVTSLLYGTEDPSIAGMVLDSPFSDLVELMMELVDTYKVRLPKFTVKFAIQYMRRAIQKKAKFDIVELNTIKAANTCFVPALFGHAVDDDFILPHHSDRIYETYVGDKNIIKFEGDHNSPRPQFYFDSINIFFHNVLQPPADEVGTRFIDPMHDYFGKDSWSSVHDIGYYPETSAALKEPGASSTADAIEQVRSRRPMSRMEVPSDISATDSQTVAKDDGTKGDESPSSSNMISFELSNGDPYGPHVPMSTNDERFVEYQLEDLTGFPSCAEEEERMLMEAVMLSLKDLEVHHPETEPQSTSADTSDTLESSPKDSLHASPVVDKCNSAKSEITPSSSVEHSVPQKEVTSPSLRNDFDLSSQQPSPDSSISSAEPPSDTSLSATSSRSDSTSVQSSSDTADVSNNTKATLTIERSPSGHIMEGLMRRWEFGFFRNNR